jgi:hypothetical protein
VAVITDQHVADAIVAAVNGVGAGLAIGAARRAGTAIVDLQNDVEGAFGNKSTAETVADAGFTVTAMANGAGQDCPATTACGDVKDCSPGLTCTGTPKTCQ